MRRGIHAIVAVLIAIALGLLEAAWTGPGRGGPTNTWLGVLAILLILAAVTWPRLWWIPGLAILEEVVHLAAGYGLLPDAARILRHWSTEFIGMNVYPWVLFPLLTAWGEFLAWMYLRRRPEEGPIPSLPPTPEER